MIVNHLILSVTFTLSSLMPAVAQTESTKPAKAWGETLRNTARPVLTRWRAWRAGVSIDDSVRIPVTDNGVLQATLYRPDQPADLPKKGYATVFLMLPYDRALYGEAVRAGIEFARAGFFVLTVDLRGYESGAMRRPVPWHGVRADAVAALDWITAQPWSNQRVGTFGCSALGETQFALAMAAHPAHRAMLVAGAGGAAGSVGSQYGYFGLFEGGVFQLASGFGWLSRHGWLAPPFERAIVANDATPLSALSALPVRSLLPVSDNAWGFITTTSLDDHHAWQRAGYVMRGDRWQIPTLTITTLEDQTLANAIALHSAGIAGNQATSTNRLVIAPGGHCDHESGNAPGFAASTELSPAQRAAQWQTLYNAWFRRWLTDDAPATELAPVSWREPGNPQWQTSDDWPPIDAHARTWRLASTGDARSVRAHGRLIADSRDGVSEPHAWEPHTWFADPADPVPSIGGPVCCTGSLGLPGGGFDQALVEARDDVLVFTSDPFDKPVTFAGPVTARLWFSSDAPDADLIVRITRVGRDGRSINLQEGAQRVSLRQQFNNNDNPGPYKMTLLAPNQIVPVDIHARDIVSRFEPGERLRVHVAASAFPRLARNPQTGEDPLISSRMQRARHQLHQDATHVSTLTLRALP